MDLLDDNPGDLVSEYERVGVDVSDRTGKPEHVCVAD